MQIRTSSDWRDALPFETPVLASEAMPGDASRCARCPADTPPRERTELWAVKHRHPNNHAGFVRLYCREHRPAIAPPPPAVSSTGPARSRKSSAPRAPRATRATPAVPERVAAVCGDCFVEVPASGICGVCGERVS
ncbi:glucose-6-phosphate dehydrogenase [Microbacterium schleiferi]|uniref:Glucose-6-phosphate dehydrogenase n=1 Tax=Microbacterium schleiferi TaxID=69362 RepID=A0A7S8MWX1_9MICO|nr:glucose-6-phosphate dehydrogenase [Microbacterium schleiferi]QPE04198.1 glucose-6-phosphate dehydrogenase [Microbacterium schleiferi]